MDKYSEILMIVMATIIVTKIGSLVVCIANEVINDRKKEKLEELEKEEIDE